MKTEDVLARVQQGRDLPTLSSAVTRVLRALDDDRTSAEQISDLLASDVAIAGRILASANSAYFNPGGAPLGSLAEAIPRLGFREVRQVVVTTGVIDAFSEVACPFDPLGFWKHCLVTAIAAGTLAQRSPRLQANARPGDNPYFVAGLMHDVGVLVLVRALEERYEKLLAEAEGSRSALRALESAQLGFTHADVGAALIRAWGLPEPVALTAAHHHAPEACAGEHRVWVELIHVADWITDDRELGVVVEGDVGSSSARAWQGLGIDAEVAPEILDDFDQAAVQSEMLLAVQR